MPNDAPPLANPLLERWSTPFGVPPFDRIRTEHFLPAFEAAMAENLAEIAAISGEAAAPSFANTVESLERAGRLLGQVARVFHNLVSSVGGDELEAVERDVSPMLAAHFARVSMDPGVFARVGALHARRGALGLAPDQSRLLERLHLNLVRAGAALDAAGKARMAAIGERLAVLTTAFSQNVMHDEKEWVLRLGEGDLEGLPAFLRDAAREEARGRGEEGWAITLSRSSVEPFLAFSARPDLRRVAYEAWTSRGYHPGPHENAPLIREILVLRAERARLLGYETYAHYRLADSMAGTPEAVRALLMQVWAPARRRAEGERAELEAQAASDGAPGPVEEADWRFWAERVRKARYDLDEAEVKPFLPLEAVQGAAFEAARRLFGAEFHARDGIPAYHPDMRAFEVREGGVATGLFLSDNFARRGKASGAWMSSYADAERFDGVVPPVIVNNNNFARATPALLGFDDARTLFHELGHGLHGLLSKARYPSQSGTAVTQDFVEFPSQVFEHWFTAPETLRAHARHFETGAPMPEELLARIRAAANFQKGFATVEFIVSALLDLEMHLHPDPAFMDPVAFEREVMAGLGVPRGIGARHRPGHFRHVFAGDGYAAGYYAYMWAEVLDADGFEAFREAGDIYDPRLAAGLKAIYEAGDTRDPMELYVAFRGRKPDARALLTQRGLLLADEA